MRIVTLLVVAISTTTCGSDKTETDSANVVAGPEVSLRIIGSGRGRVTSEMGSDGRRILSATPDPGYVFAGWRGGCTGRGTCQPSSGSQVLAVFSAAYYWSYFSAQALYGIGLDGSNVESLTAYPRPATAYAMSASDDGSSVVYASAASLSDPTVAGPTTNLWLMDFDTGSITPITRYLGAASIPWGRAGFFSPDGQRVLFLSNLDPTSVGEAAGTVNLWTIERDGSNPLPITTDGLVFWPDWSRSEPNLFHHAWSPNGAKIAYIAATAVAGDTGTTYNNIWLVNPNGTGAQRLTDYTSTTISADPGIAGISWSADGTLICFVAAVDPNNQAAVSVENVWTLRVSDRALTAVTEYTVAYGISEALFAPAGRTIVFTSNKDLAGTAASTALNLWSIEADGSLEAPLTLATAAGARNAAFVWHSDRTTLLFESNIDPSNFAALVGARNIWKATLSTAPSPITRNGSGIYDYTLADNND